MKTVLVHLGARQTFSFAASAAIFAVVFALGGVVTAPAFAQAAIDQYGDLETRGAEVATTISLAPREFATVFATAQVRVGQPNGQGTLTRSGVGVDIFMNDEICAADRDIRRILVVADFEGEFATSTTCIRLIGEGEHRLSAEMTSINAAGGLLTLRYSVIKGRPAQVEEQRDD